MEAALRAPTLASTPSGPGHRHQAGQAIVLIALMLTVLIGMVAIAIDGSRAYAVRRDLQAATDAAALAAADGLQQSGSYVTAEQNATAIFGKSLRLYAAPTCTPYGTPGASAWTVTCSYSDGTAMTDVARVLGPQGSRFQISATRTLQLQFGRVLTNGTNPTLGASAQGSVNNLRYTPTIAGLAGAGCGGVSGDAISVNGSGTLSITGDVVANGTIGVAAGAVRVAGGGGDCTKMTSTGPTLRTAVRLVATNDSQLAMRRKKPEFGVA